MIGAGGELAGGGGRHLGSVLARESVILEGVGRQSTRHGLKMGAAGITAGAGSLTGSMG